MTSSEDELELSDLPNVYTRAPVGESITRYQTTGHYFYLMNNGYAVNFLHGASVGPFIFLVQAEILAAVHLLAHVAQEFGMREVDPPSREVIAATWLNFFNK